MRILWFTSTPSCYRPINKGYNGCGWISSLETEIKNRTQITLGICFNLEKEPKKILQNGVTYYPVTIKTNIIERKLFRISNHIYQKYNNKYISEYLKVINDFQPDIIHIFGSENSFGLISLHTKIPIVQHIQGIINPIFNAYFPPGYSYINVLFSSLNLKKIIWKWVELKNWNLNINREKIILSNISYFMGRTEWDKRIINIYSPHSQYFHCEEVLRPVFYEYITKDRSFKKKDFTIVSTISSPLYKGLDLILKTAYLLKNHSSIHFKWKVYGISDTSYIEKKTGIKCSLNNIEILGIASAETIADELLNSDIYIHPSYIDNSPNSICEAQILGCPVIATNIGGIPSLIENEINGLLVPANDPYQITYLIKKIYDNKAWAKEIGNKGKEVAIRRHNKENICYNIINTYNKIITSNKNHNEKLRL